jgi:hypothetical protein
MSLRMGGVTGNNFSGGSCGGNKFLGCIRQPLCLLNFVCLGCVLLNTSRLLLWNGRGEEFEQNAPAKAGMEKQWQEKRRVYAPECLMLEFDVWLLGGRV